MTELNQALGMKEQIISLLDSNCKVRVKHNSGDIYLLTSYTQGFFMSDALGVELHDTEIKEILEVIPPTLPEYKVGDKVMVYIYGTWEGPFEIDIEYGDIFVWYDRDRYSIPQFHACPYHEGVTYNALPDTK